MNSNPYQNLYTPEELEQADVGIVDAPYSPANEDEGDKVTSFLNQPLRWGSRITVQGSTTGPQNPANLTPGISTPVMNEGQDWTITYQCVTTMTTTLLPINTALPGVWAKVTYGIGAATFTKFFLVAGLGTALLPPQRLYIHANFVEVDFFLVANRALSTTFPLPVVNVGISQGRGSGPADFYAWQWGNRVTGADNGAIWVPQAGAPQGGCVGIINVNLKTAQAPGTNLWPLLFDTASTGGGAPVTTVSVPITGCTLGALANAGDERNFSDELNPGKTLFFGGLWIALSTTPDVYTAPTAGNVMVAEVSFGS